MGKLSCGILSFLDESQYFRVLYLYDLAEVQSSEQRILIHFVDFSNEELSDGRTACNRL